MVHYSMSHNHNGSQLTITITGTKPSALINVLDLLYEGLNLIDAVPSTRLSQGLNTLCLFQTTLKPMISETEIV